MSSRTLNSWKMADESHPGNRFLGAITEELDETELEHGCQPVIKAEQRQRKLCCRILTHALHRFPSTCF